MVARAISAIGRTSATMEPDAAATTHETISRSQAAAMDERPTPLFLVVLQAGVNGEQRQK